MPSPAPEAIALARTYRLALAGTPRSGPAGERLGKGAGSSFEFQDRRVYVPGDDVRHLDWQAYARTDQLMVRLYREEVLPLVELVVDGSRSMAAFEAKGQRTVDITVLLAGAARSAGFQARVLLLGERPERFATEQLMDEGLAFEGRRALMDDLAAASGLLRAGAIRILVSDFLSPHDPRELVRSFGAAAGELAFLQVLAEEDREPEARAALRLEDAESGAALDVVLDRTQLSRYKQRLARLEDGLRSECRRASALFTSLVATGSLTKDTSRALLEEGWLAVD